MAYIVVQNQSYNYYPVDIKPFQITWLLNIEPTNLHIGNLAKISLGFGDDFIMITGLGSAWVS